MGKDSVFQVDRHSQYGGQSAIITAIAGEQASRLPEIPATPGNHACKSVGSSPSRPLRIVLLGYPGSGKDIHADNIARRLGLPHISMGSLLKRIAAIDSHIGDIAARHRHVGALLPDALVAEVLSNAIAGDHSADGFVLQGFPRTLHQAEVLDALLGEDGVSLALQLVVPRAVLVHRLLARRNCLACGMPYGTAGETIIPPHCGYCGGDIGPVEGYSARSLHNRLANYDNVFRPVATWFATRVPFVSVDGVGTPESVAARLAKAIATHTGHPSTNDPVASRENLLSGLEGA
ncbi:MAG: adenylate kinase family protein [Acidimicrobiales bacterium]